MGLVVQMKMMKASQMIKYTVLDQTTSDTNADVMITEGKFEGFVYNYGVLKVSEDEEGQGILSYNYELKSAPEEYVMVDEEAEKKEFETLIGDILVDIIMQEMENDIVNRNSDSEQSS